MCVLRFMVEIKINPTKTLKIMKQQLPEEEEETIVFELSFHLCESARSNASERAINYFKFLWTKKTYERKLTKENGRMKRKKET